MIIGTKNSVAIIGGGIAGLSLAYFLEKRGVLATIFDEYSEVNASNCSQGAATVKGLKVARSSLFQAKISGHSLLLNMIQDVTTSLKLTKPLYKFGVYEPFETLSEFQKNAQRIYKNEFLGPFDVEYFGKALSDEVPNYIFNAPSYFYPRDFFFDTKRFISGLKKTLRSRGVMFIEKTIRNIERLQKKPLNTQLFQIAGRQYTYVFICCSKGIPSLLEGMNLTTPYMKEKSGIIIKNDNIYGHLHGIKFGTKSINFLGGLRVGSCDFKGRICSEVLNEGKSSLRKLFLKYISSRELNQITKSNTTVSQLEFDHLIGTRVLGKRGSPIIEQVDKYNDKWKNLWIISGLYKSGYYLGPYFGSLIADKFPEILSQRELKVY